jgi:hypothetical protein
VSCSEHTTTFLTATRLTSSKSPHRRLHCSRQNPAVPPALRARELHPPLPLRGEGARSRLLALRLCYPRSSRRHRVIHPGPRWPLLAPNGDALGPSWPQATERQIQVQGPAVGAELRNTGLGPECGRCVHHHGRAEECHRKAAARSDFSVCFTCKGTRRALTSRSCLIDPAKIDTTKYALQTIDICTQTDNYILQDGFKSFPSGHSSGRSWSTGHPGQH